jgi:hypothetical protein
VRPTSAERHVIVGLTLDEQTTALSGTGAALVGDTGTGVACYDASNNTVKLPKGGTIGF